MNPADIRRHADQAMALAQAGQYPAATSEFAKAAVLAKDELLGHEGHAQYEYLATEVVPRARAVLNAAVASHPQDPAAHLCLGVALGLVGDCGAAASELRLAVRLDPALAAARHHLGLLLQYTGDQSAIQELHEAARLQPDNAEYRAWYALALNQAGEQETALGELYQAALLAPRNAWVRSVYGLVLLSGGQVNAARPELQAAIVLDPHLASAYDGMGSALMVSGEVPLALEHYRRAVALHPREAGFHNHLAEALAAAGSVDETPPEAKRACDPGAPGGAQSVSDAGGRAIPAHGGQTVDASGRRCAMTYGDREDGPEGGVDQPGVPRVADQEVFGPTRAKCSYCGTALNAVRVEVKRPVPAGAKDLGLSDTQGALACPKCERVVFGRAMDEAQQNAWFDGRNEALIAAGKAEWVLNDFLGPMGPGQMSIRPWFRSAWRAAITRRLEAGDAEAARELAMRCVHHYAEVEANCEEERMESLRRSDPRTFIQKDLTERIVAGSNRPISHSQRVRGKHSAADPELKELANRAAAAAGKALPFPPDPPRQTSQSQPPDPPRQTPQSQPSAVAKPASGSGCVTAALALGLLTAAAHLWIVR